MRVASRTLKSSQQLPLVNARIPVVRKACIQPVPTTISLHRGFSFAASPFITSARNMATDAAAPKVAVTEITADANPLLVREIDRHRLRITNPLATKAVLRIETNTGLQCSK